MKLTDITINNFRSISESSVNIQEISGKQCSILLGINEAGKSNILKAISLLDNSEVFEYKTECNKQAQDNGEEILVTYSFTVEKDETQEIISKINIPDGLRQKVMINQIERKVEIDSTSKRNDYYHIYINEISTIEKYVKQKDNQEVKLLKEIYTSSEKVTEENIKTLVGENYELLTKLNIESMLEKIADEYFEKIRPKTILWKPSHSYLINDSISLNDFKDDFNTSIPLRNIFRLSGISDEHIKSRIELIATDEDKRSELEETLTDGATKYINKRWKEHKINIKVKIEESLACKVKIEDKDNTKPKFRMDQRSDGFKQFISILLNLSAENETNSLKNKIISLDEPEVHLHPSGIKYLRDGLLKIAKNNTVFVATHSIFMVDKANINRHYSVWKDENSITQLEQIDKDNPLQEEVVYESLGTSIYEIIKENVLVFEGRSDKDYFDFFTKKFKTELAPLNFYTIAATGVEKIPNYIKFLKDGLIRGFALVDSDQKGRDIKKQIIENDNEFQNRIFEINDIKDLKYKATLEDLLPFESINNFFTNKYSFEYCLEKSKPVIEQIIKKLKENKKYISDDEFKKVKLELHQSIIKDLSNKKAEKIKSEYKKYYNFIVALHSRLKDN